MPSRKPSRRGSEKLATVGIIVYSRQYRSGLLATLIGRDGLIPVDLGDGGDESMRQLTHLRPEIMLVDLPRALLATLLRTVHIKQPSLAILAVNCDENEEEILTLFEAGLTGFVPHDAEPKDLLAAIGDALRGEFHCPPRIAAALVRRVNASGAASRPGLPTAMLTRREVQVAALLERSMTNKEIAEQLRIEAATVKNHVHNILEKLAVHRRGDAASQFREAKPRLGVVRGKKNTPIDRTV